MTSFLPSSAAFRSMWALPDCRLHPPQREYTRSTEDSLYCSAFLILGLLCSRHSEIRAVFGVVLASQVFSGLLPPGAVYKLQDFQFTPTCSRSLCVVALSFLNLLPLVSLPLSVVICCSLPGVLAALVPAVLWWLSLLSPLPVPTCGSHWTVEPGLTWLGLLETGLLLLGLLEPGLRGLTWLGLGGWQSDNLTPSPLVVPVKYPAYRRHRISWIKKTVSF